MSDTGGIRYPEGFVENHAMMSGNTQSGHGVIFGELDGQRVAVKPFVRQKGEAVVNIKKAEHEAAMYRKAAKLGFQTLRPIQAVQGDGTTAFLISEFRPRLVPLTGFDLRPTSVGEQALVSDVTSTLGRLHAERLTHGDAKPRNFSFDRLFPGEVVVTDLEAAQVHQKTDMRSADYFENQKKNDVRSVSETLARNGFGFETDPLDLEDLFQDIVIAPYAKEVQKIEPLTVETAFSSFLRGVEGFATEDHKYLNH